MTEAGQGTNVAAVSDPFQTKAVSQDGRIAYATVTYTVTADADHARGPVRAARLGDAAKAAGLQVEYGGEAVQAAVADLQRRGTRRARRPARAGRHLRLPAGRRAPARHRPGRRGHRHGRRLRPHLGPRPDQHRADARADGRPGRRHRLRAVHHHPTSGEPRGRPRPAGGRRPRGRHRRQRGRVRRRHRDDRPGRPLGRRHPVPDRDGSRRGRHGGDRRPRRPHPGARVPRLRRQPLRPLADPRPARSPGPPGHPPVVRQPLGPRDHRASRWPSWSWRSSAPAIIALPALKLELGLPDDGTQPTSTTQRQAYDLLAEGFGPGFNGPLTLVVDGTASGIQQATTALARAAARR